MNIVHGIFRVLHRRNRQFGSVGVAGAGKALSVSVLIAALACLCAACALPGSTGAGSVAAGAAVAQTDSADPALGPRIELPDPIAPAAIAPVVRARSLVAPRVAAHLGGLSVAAPAAYADGVSLVVKRFQHGAESGTGPGAFPGRAYTALFLTLTNRSKKVIDLNQVVITTTYGSPARIASPVYDDVIARDFSGTVKPGASSSAAYLFAVPTTQLSRVTVTVDFDSLHVAARLTGNLR